MAKTMRVAVLGLAFATMLAVVPSLAAQSNEALPDDPVPVPKKQVVIPLAPVPAPIKSARKIFIANAAEGSNVPLAIYEGDADRAYNAFYDQMKGWGHYELVSSPTEADLVFEIRFSVLIGEKVADPRFTVRIRDVKTNVLLWEILENVPLAVLKSNRERNFDQTIGALADDVKKLAGPPAPVPAT